MDDKAWDLMSDMDRLAHVLEYMVRNGQVQFETRIGNTTFMLKVNHVRRDVIFLTFVADDNDIGRAMFAAWQRKAGGDA